MTASDSEGPSAHVDGCVRLDVLHVGVGEAQLLAAPLHRADDPRGDGVLQGQRAPHRHHKLPLADVAGAAEWQRGQGVLGPQERRESGQCPQNICTPPTRSREGPGKTAEHLHPEHTHVPSHGTNSKSDKKVSECHF